MGKTIEKTTTTMLLDNEKRDFYSLNEGNYNKQAVYQYFEEYIGDGKLRIVTGYFTVSALA